MEKHVDKILKSTWKITNPCLEIPLNLGSLHDINEDYHSRISRESEAFLTREVLFEKYDPKRRDWQLCVLDYIDETFSVPTLDSFMNEYMIQTILNNIK